MLTMVIIGAFIMRWAFIGYIIISSLFISFMYFILKISSLYEEKLSHKREKGTHFI